MDHSSGRYYFESVTSPGAFWVDLKSIDFTGGVKRLPYPEEELVGDVSDKFLPAEPYPFIHATARRLQVV